MLKYRIFNSFKKEGEIYRGTKAVVYVLSPKPPRFRDIYISISRKRGHAYFRNRIKRWIREVLRKRRESADTCYFVVVKNSYSHFREVLRDLTGILPRGLYVPHTH